MKKIKFAAIVEWKSKKAYQTKSHIKTTHKYHLEKITPEKITPGGNRKKKEFHQDISLGKIPSEKTNQNYPVKIPLG